jgi:Protein of unknown function (DUF4019)
MVSPLRLTFNDSERTRRKRLLRFRQAARIARTSIFLSAVATLAACSPQVSNEDIRQAETAAQSWLGQVDAAEYAASWDAAAGYFRDRIPKAQWVARVSGVRDPLGKLKTRQESSVRFRRTLPGAPDGEAGFVHLPRHLRTCRRGAAAGAGRRGAQDRDSSGRH